MVVAMKGWWVVSAWLLGNASRCVVEVEAGHNEGHAQFFHQHAQNVAQLLPAMCALLDTPCHVAASTPWRCAASLLRTLSRGSWACA
jgi:hypothetical protein